jgi:probable F420-dependent oxidoreductase
LRHPATPDHGGVKVRFGVGLGRGSGPAELPAIVDRLEAAGVDSLWFSELVYSPQVEPVVGMAHALARTSRLKVGTGVAILPGRHPALVAKQLASLAALAPKRVLPVFGLEPANPAERGLFPVPQGRRGALFDESVRLLRALLSGAPVDFEGEFLTVRSAAIGPRPDPPLDIWLAGSAPGALRRAGRLADGWLGSFMTPAQARQARETIEAAAAAAGREIEPDHYGISLSVSDGTIPASLAAVARARRPDADPADLIAADWPALHRMLDGYVRAGLTKFVVRPAGDQTFDQFLERFLAELTPRQTAD